MPFTLNYEAFTLPYRFFTRRHEALTTSPQLLLPNSFTENFSRLIVSFRNCSLTTENCSLFPNPSLVSSRPFQLLSFDFQLVSPFPAVLTSYSATHRTIAPVCLFPATFTDVTLVSSLPASLTQNSGEGSALLVNTLVPKRNSLRFSESRDCQL